MFVSPFEPDGSHRSSVVALQSLSAPVRPHSFPLLATDRTSPLSSRCSHSGSTVDPSFGRRLLHLPLSQSAESLCACGIFFLFLWSLFSCTGRPMKNLALILIDLRHDFRVRRPKPKPASLHIARDPIHLPRSAYYLLYFAF